MVLEENKWHHIVCALRYNLTFVYVNGVLGQKANSSIPNGILRGKNYIGKSNTISDPLFIGSIDDLQIYNTSLTHSQILNIYRKSY